MFSVGHQAPDFSLPSSDGRVVRLSDFRGKVVVLYFYPADDTPTCTSQACSFQEHLGRFQRAGAVVLGVSPDSVQSHRRFAENHGLRFPLLSDETKLACKAYGVWRKKTLFGRSYIGVVRTTFVIDETGRIKHVFSNVRVKGHIEAVLNEI
jgi:peroxiredoxin Q/BCP